MLTQFGRHWINTEGILAIKEQNEATFLVIGGGNTLAIHAYDDPEGFKAFKTWLQNQSAAD